MNLRLLIFYRLISWWTVLMILIMIYGMNGYTFGSYYSLFVLIVHTTGRLSVSIIKNSIYLI